MAVRVTNSEVRAVTQLDVSFSAAIDSAIVVGSAMVDEHLVPLGVHSDTMLRAIELYLAAHFALLSSEKGPLSAISIGEATERYHDIYDAGLKATRFGQQAIALDTTGTLAELTAKAMSPTRKAQIDHIATAPYDENDNI